MQSKLLISKSTLAAVLAGTALTLGSAAALAADEADAPDSAQIQQDDGADAAGTADSDVGSADADSAGADADSADADTDMDVDTDADAGASSDGGFITQQDDSQTLAKDIMGISLRDGPGDDATEIGKITNLILDEDDKLAGVVVGVGGFLGIGQKDVGVPWDRIDQVNEEDKTAVSDLTKDELKDAPEFMSAEEQRREEEAQRQMEENQSQAPAGGAPAAPAQ